MPLVAVTLSHSACLHCFRHLLQAVPQIRESTAGTISLSSYSIPLYQIHQLIPFLGPLVSLFLLVSFGTSPYNSKCAFQSHKVEAETSSSRDTSVEVQPAYSMYRTEPRCNLSALYIVPTMRMLVSWNK